MSCSDVLAISNRQPTCFALIGSGDTIMFSNYYSGSGDDSGNTSAANGMAATCEGIINI